MAAVQGLGERERERKPSTDGKTPFSVMIAGRSRAASNDWTLQSVSEIIVWAGEF